MNLLITDFETTGLNPEIHEIIEIGATLVDADTLEIINELDLKVRPEHIETAQPRALEINGYNEGWWQNAVSLETAYHAYHVGTEGAVFTAQNVMFDYGFYLAMLKKVGQPSNLDYHRLDVASMAFPLFYPTVLSLKNINQAMGIEPEVKIHRGINGARKALETIRGLREMGKIARDMRKVSAEMTRVEMQQILAAPGADWTA